MFLEITSTSHEEDPAGVRYDSPVGGAHAGPAEAASQPVARELLADVSCARALMEKFGEVSDAFRIVPVDLAMMLSTGSGASLSRSSAIVMAPVLAGGLSAVDAVEQLRALMPHVGIYLVVRETTEVSRALPRLAAAGVDEIFCLEANGDVDAFEETLRARLSAPAPETEIRLLWKWFRESPERSLVMHCVRNGYRLDVWSVRSRIFSQCRKSLQNRVSLLGLPSPGILSRCGRVLHAQELERRGVKPTQLVAATLGFPSSGAMQRARRRLRKALMSRGRQALVFASLLK